MKPKVSIITTTYNNADMLKEIAARVAKQDYENIEYVIVDGASKDNTIAVIKELENQFGDRLKWISEPDQGIYDAINKGVKLASGEIIGMMFDQFASEDVISQMVEAISRSGADGVHGDLDYVNGDRIVRHWSMGEGSLRSGWMPGHPTMYLKKDVYETYGLYKTDYRIAADYEFMVRILKDKQVKLCYIPKVLVKMYYGGTSTEGAGSYIRSFKESYRALRENKVTFPLFILGMRTIRVLLQFVRK